MKQIKTTRRVFFKGVVAAGVTAVGAKMVSAKSPVALPLVTGTSGSSRGDLVLNAFNEDDLQMINTAWAHTLSTTGSLRL